MQVDAPLIGVVGATGAVGRELLVLLAERGHPPHRILATASEHSRGQSVPYGESDSVRIGGTDVETLASADAVILASSADVARRLAPLLFERGCLVIDNSSAFRGDPDVPLVVPEVNGAELQSQPWLVANPNCSTILLLVALEPLRQAFGLDRVVVSTYQAVSGAGVAAMDELREQTGDVLAGREARPSVFPEPCAFNVFPHESSIDEATGLNGEEQKIISETRRIWSGDDTQVIPTCARVPVVRSHCQSVVVTLQTDTCEADVRAAIGAARSVELVDDRTGAKAPTSLRATGVDEVLVGRIRTAPRDRVAPDGRSRTFCLWLAGDQLRKGAALNALQIADEQLRLRMHVET